MNLKLRYLLLLDRDGTIVRHKPYLNDWREVELYKDVELVLSELQKIGFSFVVITNQSAIERGLATKVQVNDIHQRIEWLLKKSDVDLLEILYCPHVPSSNCECRKPKTKLGELIIDKYGFQKNRTFMIGDQLTDIEFAVNLGVHPIFLGEEFDNLVFDVPSFSTWIEVLQYLKIKVGLNPL